MAIKLSQGLLSSLGGAGGAQQPSRQPMGSGLLQPAMSSNPLVNTLVRSIGQARGMDMRTPQEKEQQLIEQQRQRLSELDPNDPTAMSELIKAYAVTDPARAIQLAAAERQRLAAESKTQEEKALKGKQEEGRSLIFDVLMTADDVTTPDVRRTVADLAQGYQVPASVITSLYGAADKGRKDKEDAKKGKYTEGSSYQVSDANGDTWNVQLMNPKEEGQAIKRIYTQIAGNELDEDGNVKTRPEGETALASAVGETPKERREAEREEAIRKQREGLWVEEQAEARRAIEGSTEALALTDQMINLLTVGVESTGGIANKAKSYLAQTFGFTTEELTNKALIVNIAGNQVLSKIRLLGANPTEGERDFLLQLGADIKNDPKAVTQAKLALARKVLSNSLARQRAKLNMTREQYEEAIQEGGALDFGFVNPYSTKEGGIPSFEEHFGLQKEKQRRKNVNPRGR